MEPKFNTSFIPKKSLQADVSAPTPDRFVQRRGTHGPGFFITLLIFIASLIGTAGVFGYSQFVQKRVKDKISEVSNVRDAFEPEVMKELVRVDTRMKEAEALLRGHVVLTPLFSILEELTLHRVKYNTFKYNLTSVDAATQKHTATIEGISESFQKVAIQFDNYRKEGKISSSLLTELGADKEGNVEFEAYIELDPRLVSFSSTIADGTWTNASLPQAVTPEPAAPVAESAPVENTDGALPSEPASDVPAMPI